MSVITEEFAQTVRRLFQLLDTGQINHAEVIWRFPMEAAAVCEKNFFRLQEVEDEFFIVGDMEACGVDFWEDIEGGVGFDDAHAGD